ncbi:hypothetical protein GQ53DRAFT_217702 [Thozetella sp. PMI_491]|nr:hypothetical protein GQ53DRAFT_217702 [Thozetella sp. PMI_491]
MAAGGGLCNDVWTAQRCGGPGRAWRRDWVRKQRTGGDGGGLGRGGKGAAGRADGHLRNRRGRQEGCASSSVSRKWQASFGTEDRYGSPGQRGGRSLGKGARGRTKAREGKGENGWDASPGRGGRVCKAEGVTTDRRRRAQRRRLRGELSGEGQRAGVVGRVAGSLQTGSFSWTGSGPKKSAVKRAMRGIRCSSTRLEVRKPKAWRGQLGRFSRVRVGEAGIQAWGWMCGW